MLDTTPSRTHKPYLPPLSVGSTPTLSHDVFVHLLGANQHGNADAFRSNHVKTTSKPRSPSDLKAATRCMPLGPTSNYEKTATGEVAKWQPGEKKSAGLTSPMGEPLSNRVSVFVLRKIATMMPSTPFLSALWQVVGVHWLCSTVPLNGIPSAVPVLPPRRGCA